MVICSRLAASCASWALYVYLRDWYLVILRSTFLLLNRLPSKSEQDVGRRPAIADIKRDMTYDVWYSRHLLHH